LCFLTELGREPFLEPNAGFLVVESYWGIEGACMKEFPGVKLATEVEVLRLWSFG
jgi:hypothetical protein